MPQVLRPRQPEVPKQPEAPRQPERPKPPEAPRQPERPKPPEMPKPETVKRPDPPKPPTAQKQAPKTPEKQNSSHSPVVEHREKMSTFARILFVVGVFGAFMYFVKLLLAAGGIKELNELISIPLLLRPIEIPVPLLTYFLNFLLIVVELLLLGFWKRLNFPGLLDWVMDSAPDLLGKLFWWSYDVVFVVLATAVAKASMSGRDGAIFALGSWACAIFQVAWSVWRLAEVE